MTPEEHLARALKRAERLLKVEAKGAKVGDPIDAALAEIVREIARKYVMTFGSTYVRNPDPAKLAPILLAASVAIRAISVSEVEASILETAKNAYVEGLVGAYQSARKRPPLEKRKKVRISKKIRDVANDARTAAGAKLLEAADSIEKAESWGGITTSIAKAKQAATTTRGASAFATNRAASDATDDVAEKLKSRKVWVAETDACVHCVAYAGHIAGDDGKYPGGLTYGKKPIVPKGQRVDGPPLHWYCRCRESLIGPNGGDDFAAALRREAERSVARGFSLPSESTKTRLAATTKLLEGSPKLPPTVLAYARRSVKKGEYSLGRGSRLAPKGT